MGAISDYDTVDGTCEDEMSLKGSRFIGIVMPCRSEDDIQPNLAEVSKRYPNATHYCYAAVHSGSERRERGPATTGSLREPPASPSWRF